MSQSALLEAVATWTEEECKNGIDDVLPRLVSYLRHDHQMERQIETFHVLCSHLLRHLALERMEQEFFEKCMPEIGMLISKMYADLTGILCNKVDSSIETEVSALLQLICKILDSLTKCFQILSSSEGLLLEHLYSLPRVVINTLVESYKHCNVSKELYGDLITAFGEPLKNLYRKLCTLQMAFLGVVEKLSLNCCVEKDVSELVNLCEGICILCEEVSKIEVKNMAFLWKTYKKLIVQYQDCLKDYLNVGPVLTFLCHHTEECVSRIEEISRSQDTTSVDIEKEFTKLIKVCSFNMKIVVTICDTFAGYLEDGINEILHLILRLYSLSPSGLHAAQIDKQKIVTFDQSVIVGIAPLVFYLIDDTRFMYKALTLSKEDSCKEFALSYCLLVCCILENLQKVNADILQKWVQFDEAPSLLDSVFILMELCFVEVNLPIYLPGIMVNGKPPLLVSLYEYVLTRFSGLVAVLPSSLFGFLENRLCDNLLHSYPLRNLLAADTWCFVARYGQPDLCFKYCCLLTHMLEYLSKQKLDTLPVHSLLKRILKFLSEGDKIRFTSLFPPNNHLILWKHLPLGFLPQEIRLKAVEQIVSNVTPLIKQCSTQELSLSAMQMLVLGTEALSNVLSGSDDAEFDLQPLCESILNVIGVFPIVQISECKLVYMLACTIIKLLSSLLPFLQGAPLRQALKFITAVWDIGGGGDQIALLIIDFLGFWATKTIETCPEKNDILKTLSVLFSKSLLSDNQLVSQQALEALTTFAYQTTHEEVIPWCLQENEALEEMMTKFITQEPMEGKLKEPEMIDILLKQEARLKKLQANTIEERINPNASDIPMEPPSKKIKLDTDSDVKVIEKADDSLTEIITTMRKNMNQVEDILSNGVSIPENCKRELQLLHLQIKKYL